MNDDTLYLDARFQWNDRELTVRRSMYQHGDMQPAILCFDNNDPECCEQNGVPYGVLTVNLNHPACAQYDDLLVMQFVDVNNWPGIEDILKDCMWCEPSQAYVQSGFVKYPIYIFSPDIQPMNS